MSKIEELYRKYIATITNWEDDMAKMASLHAELNSIPSEEQDEQEQNEQQISEA